MTKVKGRNDKGRYEKDGKMYVSVTTVQRELFDVPIWLLKWYCKLGFEQAMGVFKAAGTYGTALHHAFDTWFFKKEATQKVTDAPFAEYTNRIRAIQRFIEREGIKPLFGEQTLYSEKDGVAGTCDFVGVKEEKKELWILDYKSGKEKRFKETMQVAQYASMFIENHSEYVTYAKVVALIYVGKDDTVTPEIKIYPNDVVEYAARMFKCSIELLRYKTYVESL
jgi:hypothetical protein